MRILDGLEELMAAAGDDLGPTDWVDVDQARIDRFIDATGDPTFMSVSMTNLFMPELFTVRGVSMGVNYGTDRIELGPLVVAGSRVRARGHVAACDPVKGGVQVTLRVTVEVEGCDEPACVVDALSRYLA